MKRTSDVERPTRTFALSQGSTSLRGLSLKCEGRAVFPRLIAVNNFSFVYLRRGRLFKEGDYTEYDLAKS